MNIRPFNTTDQDYAAVIAVDNAVWTGESNSVEGWRHWDKTRDKQYRFQRFVVEADGRVFGYGACGDRHWAYEPGKFYFDLAVHPDGRQKGFGTALFRRMIQEIERWQPETISISSFTREDFPNGIRFLKNRGFSRAMRFPRSKLDVQAFDPGPFAGRITRVQEAGVVLKSIARHMEDTPDWLRRWYDLNNELMKDVPYHDEFTPPTFEIFQQRLEGHPRLYPEAIIVAEDGGRWVGVSGLWLNHGNAQKLETGLTGVVRSHRRMGVATAMKVAAICFAQEQGVEEIETDNEENNPMYELNMQLGFKPLPAYLDFLKEMNH